MNTGRSHSRACRHAFVALAAAAASAAATARADETAYPAKPVRVIVAYGAGGTDDYIARLFSERLANEFGRQFIVDNRPSAGGVIGFDALSKAPADGYTLGVAGANVTVLPSVRRNLSFDPLRSFTPISQLTATQLVLVAHPSVPARTVQELIALGRARPGVLTYGSSGTGATPHLAAELFKSMTGLSILHVPYKSGVVAMTDLAAGRIDVYFGLIGGITTTLIEAGRVRPMAVTGLARHPGHPGLPTMTEAGLTGFELTTWYAMLGPAGLPPRVVSALGAALRRAVASRDVSSSLISRGAEPVASGADELRALMERSVRRFGDIVRKAGIQPE